MLKESRDWKISRGECEKIFQKANRFLEKRQAARETPLGQRVAIGTIRSQWGIYSCQFVAYQKGGKKFVYLNVFPHETSKTNPNLEKNLVRVFDGGPSYWKIVYDVEADAFVEFWANGPA